MSGQGKIEEWSIRDEATGEWWLGFSVGWGRAEDAARYPNHWSAAHAAPFDTAWVGHFRKTSMIVPAPPREMTDAEALQWAFDEDMALFPYAYGGNMWNCRRSRADVMSGGQGRTIFDAIRAARRKLEGK